MRSAAVIQILLWAPLAAGLVACAMPQRLTGWAGAWDAW